MTTWTVNFLILFRLKQAQTDETHSLAARWVVDATALPQYFLHEESATIVIDETTDDLYATWPFRYYNV